MTGREPARPQPGMTVLRRCAAAVAVAGLVTTAGCSDEPGPDAAPPTGGAEEETAEEVVPAPGWRHLGYDLANSRAPESETAIDPGNVATLRPAWELEGVKGVTSTPVVVNGTVYVGDWTGHVRALDAAGGDEIWAADVGSQYVAGAVALDEERVFAGSFSATVVALDRATGDAVWEQQIDDHPHAAVFGSPTHVDGLVIVPVGSYENMLASGEEATFRGSLVALDPTTGEEVWRYWTTTGDEDEGPGVGVWTSPAVDTERGHLYFGTGQHHFRPTTERSDAVIALDVETGEEVWVHQFTEGDVWTLPDGGADSDVSTPPNLFEVDGRDAVGAGDKAGTYKALDRETGEELWSAELTEGSLQGGVMASAAVADGRVFVASNEAGVTADLLALDLDTGDEVWRTPVGASMVGPVTWANGVVFGADNSGRIAGYDAEDGSRIWSHEVATQAAGGISVVDGTVYAGWGWWLSAPPEDPQGGFIAFRPGEGSPDGDGSGSGDGAGEPRDGSTVYQQSCATCHGGDGSGASGPALAGAGDRLTRDEVIEVVRDGRGEMPSWEGSLSPEEIEAVADHVRGL